MIQFLSSSLIAFRVHFTSVPFLVIFISRYFILSGCNYKLHLDFLKFLFLIVYYYRDATNFCILIFFLNFTEFTYYSNSVVFFLPFSLFFFFELRKDTLDWEDPLE